jgi:ABC-2 type transport system permease protein
MRPILNWTLYQRRWSMVGWSIGAFFFIFINMIFYPSFRDDAAALQKSFESLPESAIQLFGGSTDFFSPIGFLNSQIYYLMLPLILGMLAIALGSSLLAREEHDRTMESLLARPLSRSNLLKAKAVAGTVIVTIVSIVSLLTTVAVGKLVDLNVPFQNIALASLACFLMVLSFGAVAFLLTATGKARGASIAIASTFALGGYLVGSLSGTVDWLKIPSKIFPFSYYQPEAILRGSVDWMNMLFFVAVIVTCGLLSWATFRRRDIA